ncbi:class A beta-lactamase-related serine hydrolase [bacterium]|nr:MAG: class A beta-lactamase-related serine hydrolase [bacterium]
MKRFNPISILAATATLSTVLTIAHAQHNPILTAPIRQLPDDFRAAQLPPALSADKVRAHVIKPLNVENVKSFEFVGPRQTTLKPTRVFKLKPRLDVGAFGTAVHSLMKDQATGYTFQVRRGNQTLYNLQWDYARTPADGAKGWTPDTRMHIASISKLLTAMGMIKALDMKGVSEDAKIIDYLPTYWAKGNNINKITFRNLLQQTSGFNTGTSSSDYSFMKGKFAAGVPSVGSYDYENMNFGICRILIPILMGNINKNVKFTDNSALNDSTWDAVTLYHYKNFMQSRVFSPSGVQNADFDHIAGEKSAYAYKFPAGNAKGWDSGDLSSVAGGAGWRLSIEELLSVMSTFRKGTIVPASRAQFCMDNYFGLDQVLDTPAGKLYNKNGAWGDGGGRREQCVAYFMPDNIEVAIFVNSPVSAQDSFLRSIINTAYIASIKE